MDCWLTPVGRPQCERLCKWIVNSVPVAGLYCSQGDIYQSHEQHVGTYAGNAVIAKHALPFQDRVRFKQ